MKKIAVAASLPLLFAASQATAQVLYEPFDYGAGAATNLSFGLGVTPTRQSLQGTYWATRGTSSATNLQPANLAAPSYMGGANPILPTGFGNSAREVTTGSTEYATLGLGEYFNAPGDLYWSAVIKPNSIPSTTSGVMMAGILNFSLPTTAQPSTRQLALWTRQSSATTYQLGLGSNSSSSADVTWSGDLTGTTNSHFVVAKLSINGTGTTPDALEMWINPTSNFGSTTAAPAGNAFAKISMHDVSLGPHRLDSHDRHRHRRPRRLLHPQRCQRQRQHGF
jgi:hypothetical protein